MHSQQHTQPHMWVHIVLIPARCIQSAAKLSVFHLLAFFCTLKGGLLLCLLANKVILHDCGCFYFEHIQKFPPQESVCM